MAIPNVRCLDPGSYPKTIDLLTFYSPIPSMAMDGISTYIYHKNQPNVGKYTSLMDCVGVIFRGF